jgi:site-specific recombinase XerD
VLRSFYDFHLERNTGSLLVNPFPLVRSRRSARANAHHTPEKPYKNQRTGLYRPKVPKRIPRQIPEGKYTEVFAGLRSHRDRALLAFWVATGARAEELLTSTQTVFEICRVP